MATKEIVTAPKTDVKPDVKKPDTPAASALQKQESGAIAERPSYLSDSRMGLETITKKDLSIPRVALAQAQNPEVTEGDPAFVADMKPGDLFNSVTKQNYGRELFFQVVRKDSERAMEFNPIDDGGGVADPDVPLDDPRCKWGKDGSKPIATVFRDYLVLLDGTRELVALSFKSTGIKVAKQLNGLIALRGADIFAGRYRLTTATNLKPHPHKIYLVENAPKEPAQADGTPGNWVTKDAYEYGKQMYLAVKDLDTVSTIDRSQQDEDPDSFNPSEFEGQTSGRPSM